VVPWAFFSAPRRAPRQAARYPSGRQDSRSPSPRSPSPWIWGPRSTLPRPPGAPRVQRSGGPATPVRSFQSPLARRRVPPSDRGDQASSADRRRGARTRSRAQEIRERVDRVLPVPRGAHAVVPRRSAARDVALLRRVRHGRRPDRIPPADRQPAVPRGARGARRAHRDRDPAALRSRRRSARRVAREAG
jgi:hypothetical protein